MHHAFCSIGFRLRLIGLGVLGGMVLLVGCASVHSTEREEEPATEEELVNIGYGTASEGDVAYGVSVVPMDEARLHAARDLSDLLRGQVAGVSVSGEGGQVRVQIRGIQTFRGSNAPLYVLNGVPMQPGPGGTLRGLNPRDVKSITVLKNASATAIYGSRGANGVILVETR